MSFDAYLLEDILQAIKKIFFAFYESSFFGFVKIFLAIYVIVLIIDIILLLVARGVKGDLRKTLYGMDIDPVVKGKMEVKWRKIRKRLDSDSVSQFKVAILEADKEVNDLLERMGYKGKNMKEKLKGANPGQIDNLEQLREAHEIRNRIIFERDFSIDKEEAKKWMDVYEEFLRTMEAL